MNPPSDHTILIVDDQVANLDVLSELLESHGFEVLAARDGETALDIAQRAQPALILLDVILPGMGGFEVCRRLKADKLIEQIPVIFMTVLEKIEDKVQGFQLGAADYITKPFQTEEVLARITTQLHLRGLTRELREANELLEQRVAERTTQLAQVNQELQAEVVERRAAEEALSRANEALTRVNRAYRMLSGCNQIVVYAAEESTFLWEICQTIVEYGDYLRACIDLVEPDEAQTLRPVAQADAEGKHLDQTLMNRSDSDQRQVLSASVVHAREPIIYQDILSDPDLVALRAEALRDGYVSVAIFPLLTGEQETIGALTVYAGQADAFTKEEIRLFMELATDMAFGVITLRMRAERQQAEESLRESEARWRSLTENSPDHIVTLDQELSIEFANHASPGLTVEELIGTPLYTYVAEDRQAEIKVLQEQVLTTGEPASYETEYDTPDGNVIYYESRVVPRILYGEVIGLTVSARNITTRKQVEQARLSHLRFLESMDMVSRAIQGTNDLEQMMNDVLDVVLSIFDCDRAFLLYPCDPDADAWQVPMERTKPEYPGVLTLGLEMPMDADVAASLRILRESDRPVKFGPGTRYPLPAEVSAQFGFKTFMSMALYPKIGKPWQFGIHQCAYPRMWTEEEERLLQEIGQRLADALTSLLAYRQVQEREQALQQANNLLQAIIEAAPTAIVGLDLDGNVQLVWNPAAEQMLGWNAQEVMGHPLPSVPVENQEEFRRFQEQIRHGLTLDGVEVCRQRRDGTPVDYSIYASPLYNPEGHITGSISVLVDITERKRAEDALRESERNLTRSQHVAKIGNYEWFLKTNTLTWSDEVYNIFGVDKETYTPTAEDFNRFVHSDDLQFISPEAFERVTAGPFHELEFRIIAKSTQEIKFIHLWGETTFDAEGNPTHISATLQDITERKRAEETLATERNLLRTVIDNLPDYIYAKDTEGHYTLKNLAEERQMGVVSPDEVIGKTDFDYYPPELAEKYRADDQAVLQSGQPLINREEPIAATDGTQAWVLTSKVPLRDTQGNVAGLVGISRDITELKQAEQALAEERNLLRTLIDNIPDYIYFKDSQCRFITGNAAVEQLMGVTTLNDLIGKTDHDFYSPELADSYFADDQAVIHSGQALINKEEISYDRVTHETGWMLTTKTPWHDHQGNIVGLVGIGRDITERKRLEEAERHQRILAQTFQQIAESLSSSGRLENTLNLVLDQLSQIIDYDLAVILLVDGENLQIEAVQVASNRERPSDIIKTSFCYSDNPLFYNSMKSGSPVVITDVQQDSKQFGIVALEEATRSWIGIPFIVWDIVVGFLSISSEIPNTYQANDVDMAATFAHQVTLAIENSRLYSQLETDMIDLQQARVNLSQAARVAMAGEIAAGVAHQIRNPLTAIVGQTYILANRVAADSSSRQAVEIIKRSAYRAGTVVQRLLDFARSTPTEMHPMDINQSIRAAISLVRAQIELHVEQLIVNLAPDLPPLAGSEQHLEDVWVNLLLNARDAVADLEDGTINISTYFNEVKQVVEVTIQDNGTGIDPEHLENIFKPLFTTKERGTGLGLSICYDVITQHNGTIQVISEPGKGATFTVRLPLNG